MAGTRPAMTTCGRGVSPDDLRARGRPQWPSVTARPFGTIGKQGRSPALRICVYPCPSVVVLSRCRLARAALRQDHIAHTLGVGDRIEFLGGVHGGRGGERQIADPDHPLEEALVDVNRANVLGVNILVNL